LPVINNEGSGLWITFPFIEYVSSLIENEYKNIDEGSTIDDSVGQKGSTIVDTGSITGSTINKIGSTISATYRQHQILNVIKQNPKISHTEIAIHFKIQRAAVQKHLNALKKKGVLIRVGGTHGYWVVNTEK